MPYCLHVVLAGGRGHGLRPLTESLPKPLLRFGPFGRIIDFSLYNCLASGQGDTVVLTQYLSKMVELYINMHWRGAFSAGIGRLDSLPGAKAPGGKYAGPADAVEKALKKLGDGPDLIIVTGADLVYRMDYRELAEYHLSHGRAATVVAGGAVNDKPRSPAGVYAFTREKLQGYLESRDDGEAYDFGRGVLPRMAADGELRYFDFTGPDGKDGFIRSPGSLEDYWRLHMELVRGRLLGLDLEPAPGIRQPPFSRLNLIRKYVSLSKLIVDSMVSNTARIGKAVVENSVIGPGAHVEDGAKVRNSLLLDGAVVGRGVDLDSALVEARAEVSGEGARSGVHIMTGEFGASAFLPGPSTTGVKTVLNDN